MDTTSTPRRRRRGNRWTRNPHQTLPDDLAGALRDLRQHRGQLGAALVACRDAEWGVPALAVALDMKPAAVARQIQRARHAGVEVDLSGLLIPDPPLPAIHQRPAGPALPATVAMHLRELHAVARCNRGYLPPDDPRRVASAHLATDIDHLVRTGHSKRGICGVLGVTGRAVDQLLERHGLRTPPPSAAEPVRRHHRNTPGRYRR